MGKLTMEWQSIMEGVQAVTKKTEKIVERLGKLEGAKVARMPKARVATKGPGKRAGKKPTKTTVGGTILSIIKGSVEGLDIPELKEMTGLNDREIRRIIFGLRKEGQVKRVFVSQ